MRYHRSLRTFRTYRPTLESFKAFCKKTHVNDVEREDLLGFATHCIKQGRKGKSIYNKLAALSQVMKQHGRPKLLKAADWPSFVETIQPTYKDFELAKLFNACTRPEEVRFKFYLMSGFRDAEGRFVTWRDVDFKHMAVRVTSQPYWACLCLTRCRVEPSGDQLGSRGLAKSQAVILDSGLRAWDSLHQ